MALLLVLQWDVGMECPRMLNLAKVPHESAVVWYNTHISMPL